MGTIDIVIVCVIVIACIAWIVRVSVLYNEYPTARLFSPRAATVRGIFYSLVVIGGFCYALALGAPLPLPGIVGGLFLMSALIWSFALHCRRDCDNPPPVRRDL